MPKKKNKNKLKKNKKKAILAKSTYIYNLYNKVIWQFEEEESTESN